MSEENKTKAVKDNGMEAKTSKGKMAWRYKKTQDPNKYAENYDKIFGKDRTRLTKREEVLLDSLACKF